MKTQIDLSALSDDDIVSTFLAFIRGSAAFDEEGNAVLGAVYFADETSLYYAVDIDQIKNLLERYQANEEGAYSRWCAEDGYTEYQGSSEEKAAKRAGWVL
jgi:hypothetical protein